MTGVEVGSLAFFIIAMLLFVVLPLYNAVRETYVLTRTKPPPRSSQRYRRWLERQASRKLCYSRIREIERDVWGETWHGDVRCHTHSFSERMNCQARDKEFEWAMLAKKEAAVQACESRYQQAERRFKKGGVTDPPPRVPDMRMEKR